MYPIEESSLVDASRKCVEITHRDRQRRSIHRLGRRILCGKAAQEGEGGRRGVGELVSGDLSTRVAKTYWQVPTVGASGSTTTQTPLSHSEMAVPEFCGLQLEIDCMSIPRRSRRERR